jgi:hypothetical protein
LGLSQITAGKVQEYRVDRLKNPQSGKPPSFSTLHDEVVTLRLVLKAAIRHEWLAHLPVSTAEQFPAIVALAVEAKRPLREGDPDC